MNRTERLYRISQLLGNHRRPVPFRTLIAKLGVSNATLKRDLEYLRERLHAPIIWDRALRGYCFERGAGASTPRFELPGMWFNSSEAHALLAMQHLLESLTPGLLAAHVAPLKAQVRALLDKSDHVVDEIEKRIRILPMGQRAVPSEHFEALAHAVLARKRVQITHYHRLRNDTSVREVSPQRLVHYRDNWYLDTWDHTRADIREFALDAITAVELLTTNAKNVSERQLDGVLTTGYGIFAGKPTATAILRFTAERARWVARERWHPKQVSKFLEDGRYELRIPYADPRELVMDILKYGPEVEVVAPLALRDEVIARLKAAAGQYRQRKM
ncbi:MAG: WYL domain-containing protein [Gammaproteobacteria bacterium]|nr:WYL domain-containing protein [Gammaproteobacteria bacterium]